MGADLRGIFLQDHYAGATAGFELAKRAAGSNRGTPLGDFLERLADEVGDDRETLAAVMDELGVGVDRVKATLAWGAEKVGRFKPNGRLLGYSPLSRVLELEALHVGISGKLSMWQLLRATSAEGISADLGRLVARAERQLTELEPHRVTAAAEAFGSPPPSG